MRRGQTGLEDPDAPTAPDFRGFCRFYGKFRYLCPDRPRLVRILPGSVLNSDKYAMNLQQLEYILAVDTHRHFAKAAEHCRVTQPTLSMMIQRLEDEIGAKIFDRSVQPVQPTRLGEQVLKQARIVLQQTALIRDIVKEEEGSLKGIFRLGILPTIAPYLIPRFFQQMTDRHPELEIRISEMKTQPSLAALADGELDAAIIASAPDTARMNGEVLFYEQFFGYVSKNEPVFRQELIRTSDIDGERLWLLDEGHCFRDQLVRFCRMEKVKIRQAAYRLGSMETFMRMVESGNGITFIPELAVLQLSEEQRKLVRPFAIPRPTRAITLATRKDFVRHALLEVLTESIRSAVPKDMLSLQSTQKLM